MRSGLSSTLPCVLPISPRYTVAFFAILVFFLLLVCEAFAQPAASDSLLPDIPSYLLAIRDSDNTRVFVNVDTSKVQVTTDQVRVFYNWFGAYPEIRPSGSVPPEDRIRFTGLPQRLVGNDSLWALHEERVARYINHPYPTIGIDTTWSGYAVINYEAWSPLWSKTPRRYQEASLEWERTQNPDASSATIRQRAKDSYESASRTFLVRTLEIADSLRPNAHWGYYGYPHPGRIQRPGQRANRQATNDRLQWLYDAAEVLYPSIYMIQKTVSTPPTVGENTIRESCYYVKATLEEAQRLAGGKPVVPFTWHEYHNTNPTYAGSLIDGYDAELQYLYPLHQGIDAIILWGSASSDDAAFKELMRGTVAPMIRYAQDRVQQQDTDPRTFIPAPCWSETPALNDQHVR